MEGNQISHKYHAIFHQNHQYPLYLIILDLKTEKLIILSLIYNFLHSVKINVNAQILNIIIKLHIVI